MTRNQKPLTIPVTDRNVLIITAFIKKGIVTVSYKGQHRRGLFTNNTLRNMVAGRDYEKHSFQFFGAVAKLIEQIIK